MPARQLPVDLCKRLARLLLLLASDQPGEVVAAAAAITRSLRASERDWHDLAHQLTIEPPPSRSEPRNAPPSQKHAGTQAIDAHYVLDLVSSIRASGAHLSPKARGFLVSLEERAHNHGLVFFTVAQWNWFIDLLQDAKVEVEV